VFLQLHYSIFNSRYNTPDNHLDYYHYDLHTATVIILLQEILCYRTLWMVCNWLHA